MSKYYYIARDLSHLSTHTFRAINVIDQTLGHGDSESVSGTDLHFFEILLRHEHSRLEHQLTHPFNARMKKAAKSVNRDVFPSSRFHEHFSCSDLKQPGQRSLADLQRDIEVSFFAMVSLICGLEERISSLTTQLNAHDNSIWAGCPTINSSKGNLDSRYLAEVENWLRQQLHDPKPKRLKEIRNFMVHRKCMFAHLVEDPKPDVLFSSASTLDERWAEDRTVRVTDLSKYAKWLVDDFLQWWCSQTVAQIEAL